MNATPSRSKARRRRSWGVRPWTFVVYGLVVALGGLIQACSDNNGTSGPKFNGGPAGTTGFADTSADIIIRVSANPASTEPGRRVTITVLVVNGGAAGGGSGLPLAGKTVFVNTSTNGTAFGTVDGPTGTTNANGIYTTTMIVRCSDAGVVTPAPTGGGAPAEAVVVDAFVDGASSALTGTSANVSVTGTGGSPPCPGSA